MRFPQIPPAQADLLRRVPAKRIEPILQHVPGPTHGGAYLHWDTLRHLTPPSGLSHEEWWLGLKLRRQGNSRAIELKDTSGRRFAYSIVDPLPEALHLIDLSAGGQLQIPEPILNPDTKDRYIVRSLIEEAITL
jgi:hypothetical protein